MVMTRAKSPRRATGLGTVSVWDVKAFASPSPICPKPTLGRGVGSIADIFGAPRIYGYSMTPEQADRRSFWFDWIATAHDLNGTILAFEMKRQTDGATIGAMVDDLRDAHRHPSGRRAVDHPNEIVA